MNEPVPIQTPRTTLIQAKHICPQNKIPQIDGICLFKSQNWNDQSKDTVTSFQQLLLLRHTTSFALKKTA